MSKKIFILIGHPDPDSESGRLGEAYERGARASGHEVRLTRLSDLKFDPILHKGYKVIQQLEPDLLKVQEDVKWCDHFVLFYPVWWAAMPALLKGLIDRIWMPHFAYQFRKEGLLKGFTWEKLLKGRSARVIITMDNVPFVARLLFGDITNEIHYGVLRFSGFSPVRVKKIGLMKFRNPQSIKRLEMKAEHWGKIGY